MRMAGESVDLDLTGTRSPGIVSQAQIQSAYASVKKSWALPVAAVVGIGLILYWLNRNA